MLFMLHIIENQFGSNLIGTIFILSLGRRLSAGVLECKEGAFSAVEGISRRKLMPKEFLVSYKFSNNYSFARYCSYTTDFGERV